MESIINKYRKDTGMTVEDVVAKYARPAANIKATYAQKSSKGLRNFDQLYGHGGRPYTAHPGTVLT